MTKVLLWECPTMKNFRFQMTKVYSGGMPPNEKLQIWDDESLLQNTPQWKTLDFRWPKFTHWNAHPTNEKLQIWDDQSLLRNAHPPMKNFRFEMTKVYSRIPPKWKTSDFRWPKFTSECPPPNEKTSDLRWPKFTPEYPPNEKLQISDDQSLLWNAPPPQNEKLQISDDQSFTSECPPQWKNFRFQMTKVYFRIPPQWKTSDLRWPKFTWGMGPPMKYFRFEDDQSLLRNTPPNEKLQIWDDQSLLWNAPQNEKLQIWDDQSLLHLNAPSKWKTLDFRWPKFTSECPQWKTSDFRWPKFTLK